MIPCYLNSMIDKVFKDCNRDQMYLMPPSLKDWLPEGHLSYFIIDVVERLDLSEIYGSYGGDGRGQPPYDPSMMTALILYAYCVGIPSSRRIERAACEDVAFRVIAANQHPDHDSICEFRKRHLKALAGLFLQVLRLCREAGLVKLGHVALDGTKVRANASKHKAMSYGRMKQKEDELERQVRELLDLAERVDAEEDAKYGKGVRGDELPAELRHKESRLKKIREAMDALEEQARVEAAAQAEEARKKIAEREKKASQSGKKSRGRSPRVPDPNEVKPPDKAQRNFTDPDSRIMQDGSTNSFEQCYNAQAAVDEEHQVIVAAAVTQSPNDKEQLEPMVKEMRKNLGKKLPKKLTADAGYYSEDNVKVLGDKRIDGYIAVDRMKHGEVPPPIRGRPPKEMSVKERMRRKLLTKRGRSAYAKRKGVVEPVFGQIKGARGLRQFLLRGIEKVSAEWDMWCLTHNLLKLHRFAVIPTG
jgi:transposase